MMMEKNTQHVEVNYGFMKRVHSTIRQNLYLTRPKKNCKSTKGQLRVRTGNDIYTAERKNLGPLEKKAHKEKNSCGM